MMVVMNASVFIQRKNILSCLLILLIAIGLFGVSVAAYRNPKDGYCIDSESKFDVCEKKKYQYCEQDEKRSMMCSDVNKNPSLCYYDEFKRNCPIACTSCPITCKDKSGLVRIPYVNKEKLCSFKYINAKHDLCTKSYTYANHCPDKCNFCPAPAPTISPAPTIARSFTGPYVESGKYEQGFFGSQVAIARLGDRIFVTEIKGEVLYLYEYDGGDVYRKIDEYDKIIKSPTELSTSTKLATSEDGNNLIHTYNMDGDSGKVSVLRRFKGKWKPRGKITHSGNDKFGFLVDISDKGNTVMIADKISVHIYDYGLAGWQKRGNKALPIGTSVTNIIDVSMTPDGKIVAISLSLSNNLNKIKCFRWHGEKWKNHGTIEELDEAGSFSTVKLVKNSLFTGVRGAFGRMGAVYVFDLEKIKNRRIWTLRGAKSKCNLDSVKELCPSEPSCKALVTITKYSTCNAYCNHLDLDCDGAWEDYHDTCESKTDKLTCSTNFVTKYHTSDAICQCKPKNDSNNGVVVKGEKPNDELGRQLSVSRDGQFVAWASQSCAGAVKQNGDNWSNEGVLTVALKPTVSLGSSGKRLVVGLPFASSKPDSTLLDYAGRLNIFKWSGYDVMT